MLWHFYRKQYRMFLIQIEELHLVLGWGKHSCGFSCHFWLNAWLENALGVTMWPDLVLLSDGTISMFLVAKVFTWQVQTIQRVSIQIVRVEIQSTQRHLSELKVKLHNGVSWRPIKWCVFLLSPTHKHTPEFNILSQTVLRHHQEGMFNITYYIIYKNHVEKEKMCSYQAVTVKISNALQARLIMFNSEMNPQFVAFLQIHLTGHNSWSLQNRPGVHFLSAHYSKFVWYICKFMSYFRWMKRKQ